MQSNNYLLNYMELSIYSGFLFILISGTFSGIFSTPFNRNKQWAWENNWLIWSMVALIICPFIAVYFTIPNVFAVYSSNLSTTAIIAAFGVIWGISALLFGKGIDFLGVSLAIPIMQGLISSIGTIVPFLINSPSDLLNPAYYNIPLGVLVILAGIILYAIAGKGKDKASNKPGSNFKVGLIICILAGVFGPMINFGFVFGEPLQDTAIQLGAESIYSANATWAVIFTTGFIVNALQCIFLLKKNKTMALYKRATFSNYLWAAMAGILWYGSILLYGMGCNFMGEHAASIGWAIMQATAILASNVAGIIMGEWKNASKASLIKMAGGMCFLILGVIIISMSTK